MTTTIDISEVQQLAGLLDQVRNGNEVIISQGATPIARLSAISPTPEQPRQRVAGLHQGMAWVSDDFDAPLADEFWLGTE
jgi:antitoxin (DNA-binding transcriptional repressor) of toxin-antitoxin stability system